MPRFLAASAALLVLLHFSVGRVHAASEVGRPIMRVFTPRTYGADAQNFCAVQDAAGIMYFGNTNGVLTYDGAAWRVIRTGYSENIRGLALAADGNIYLGGTNQIGFLRPVEGGREYVSLRDQLPPERGQDFAVFYRVVAHRDAVYFATLREVLIWRGGRFTVLPVENATEVPLELHAVGDDVFVTAPNSPLRRIREDRLEVVSDDPFFRDKDILSVERAPEGGLFFATMRHGLFRWRDGRFSPVPTEADAALRSTGLYRARRLRNGSLALMLLGQRGTVFVSATGKFLWRVDDSEGLPTHVVTDVVGDREGGIWLCLLNGLARFELPSAFSLFEQGKAALAIARHEGELYVGNDEALKRMVPGTAETGNAHFEEIAKGRTAALLWDRDGLLVASTGAISRLGPQGLVKILPSPKIVHLMLRARRDPDRVWLAETEELSSMRRIGGEWRLEGRIENVPTGSRTLAETADGSLWSATLKDGLYRVRFGPATAESPRGPAQVTHFAPGTHGLPAKHNTMRVYEWGGRVLAVMGAEGLWLFDPATDNFSRLAQTEKQVENPKDLALFLTASQPDHLWVQRDTNQPSDLKIFRVPWEGAVQRLPHAPVDAAHFARALFEEPAPDGAVLWVAGNDGLLRVDTTQAFAPPTPVQVLVRAEGVQEGRAVDPQRRVFGFDLVAPVFRSGGSAVYQTRLLGFESDWTPWSEARQRVFTNLGPGNYRFEAQARDADGQVSPVATRTFMVPTPWWRTWWCLGLFTVSGVSGVVGITRWFANRALKRRVALLEAQSAVERERLRLARDLHDEVGSGLGRVILFAGEAQRNKADPAQLEASLNRVRDSAQTLVQHAREIVWAVSPQHDTLASAVERLSDYVEATLRAAGIACRLEAPPADAIPAVVLGSEARHNLFLAVKEAVHNCVKYSEAKTADFRLEVGDAELVVTLQDRGRGFAPGDRRGTGHGTRNIVARLEGLGGRAKIASAPGAGTTVTLWLPLGRSAA